MRTSQARPGRSAILLDPSLGSANVGDRIISESARIELTSILSGAFTTSLSTHYPLSWRLAGLRDVPVRIVLGSNLLNSRMNRWHPSWDVGLFGGAFAAPVVLMGVGWGDYQRPANFYTRVLYSRVLSREMLHSVRDSYTADRLRYAGIRNVLNTACPTMWALTPEHCGRIPQEKARNVVTTITDYRADFTRDLEMLRVLTSHYERVSVWLQGSGDYDYASQLRLEVGELEFISPTIPALDEVLLDDADYVGTRLHAGMRALQLARRVIVVIVDNRAREIQRDCGIAAIERDSIADLPALVESGFLTEIRLPVSNIRRWKEQFEPFPSAPERMPGRWLVNGVESSRSFGRRVRGIR